MRRAGEGSSFPLQNNFDLLRLLAAVQVVYFHVQFHLHPDLGPLAEPMRRVLGPLPGVPIFFVISGFLVSASYERNRHVGTYALKRALRVYPALLVCLAVTLVLLAAFGALTPQVLSSRFGLWLLAQATFGQFVHLDVFGSFGVGIPNGSLWTIPVELGFYIALPVLYVVIIDRWSRRASNVGLLAIGAASFVVMAVLANIDPIGVRTSTKLLQETPMPHLYLFVFGVLAQRNYRALARFVEGKVVWWFAAYYLIVAAVPPEKCRVALGWCPETGSASQAGLLLVSQLTLVGLVLAVAFSARGASDRVLRRNDVSYGTYLFHMLIVNALVELGLHGDAWLLPLVIASALVVGFLSWKLVERPALRWKARVQREGQEGQTATAPTLGTPVAPSTADS